MLKEIEVSSDIPATKLKRAFDNGVLSLTKDELNGSGSTLHIHPETYKKALAARKRGKGTRLAITHKEIGYPFKHLQGAGTYGGSIWGKIWGGVKKAFKWAKDSGVLSKLADAAVAPIAAYTGQPGLVTAARGGLKSLTGIGVDGGKVTLNDVKAAARQGVMYAKRKGVLTDAVDAGERYLLSKASKPEHTKLIKEVRGEVKRRYGVGVKGSAEAKEHMAKLRAMRKKKLGASFRL